jgi:hypothetical protein
LMQLIKHGGDSAVLLGLTADSPFFKFAKSTNRQGPGSRGHGGRRGVSAAVVVVVIVAGADAGGIPVETVLVVGVPWTVVHGNGRTKI